MQIKRFAAPDNRQAMRQIRETLGPDAVILSNKRTEQGVEIVAAMDIDDGELAKRSEPARPSLTTVGAGGAKPEPTPDFQPRPVKPRQAARPTPQARTESPAAEPPVHGPRRSASPADRGGRDEELSVVKRELSQLRDLMESQLSVMEWGRLSERHPSRVTLLDRLSQLGLGSRMASQLADRVAQQADPEAAWQQALELLADAIPREEQGAVDQGGVVAVVGPTGVGKTTTVAKLAARHVLRHGSRSVALVTTDNFRIGAQEQLRNFARILDVPVHTVGKPDELRDTLDNLYDKRLVLIDTAGMGQRDMRLVDQLSTLQKAHESLRAYLVLSANTQLAALNDAARSFRRIRLSRCIITKVDEAASLGGVLSTLVRHQLPAAFLGTGQRVPEDIEEACPRRLVDQAVSLMDQFAEPADNDALAAAFGGFRSEARGAWQ